MTNLTNIEKDKIKDVIEKYKIKKLFSVKTDTDDLKKEKDENNKNLNDILNYAKKEYADVRKKL